MTRTLIAAVAACVMASLLPTLSGPAAAASRIKDIANFEGVRQNQLIGYGLVVGLNGTGDTLNNIPFTKQSIQAMLERMFAATAWPMSSTATSCWPNWSAITPSKCRLSRCLGSIARILR
jgi:hypothetical protein